MDAVERMRSSVEREELLSAGWAALPESYRMPSVAPTLAEALAWCRHLAETHYENFHVASWFLPEKLRPHFHAIYAYCRVSDDLGDEVNGTEQALALLDFWQDELEACYRGEARHPVFVALAETIRACDIPITPFADLLTAFRQDQTVTRYRTMDDVLGYCRYSANPVGHLAPYVFGHRDAERFRLSDFTCSALQLANFWQDVRSDYVQRGRIYLPLEAMDRYGVAERTIADGVATKEFRGLLREMTSDTREMFHRGLPLIDQVDRELAVDLDLFSRGGLEILRAIEQRKWDVLSARPAISRRTKLALAIRAVTGKFLPTLRLRGRAA